MLEVFYSIKEFHIPPTHPILANSLFSRMGDDLILSKLSTVFTNLDPRNWTFILLSLQSRS
jgi:hypothetical protein